ncbi:MAG: DUF1841 family protein [Gammaproteobacteria bacterium]|nr:DUF1841 family protein [Gammaproteobacteria bacterium]
MFTQDRDKMRKFFISSWQKKQNNEPMEQLEDIVADIIARHPEYQSLLEKEDAAIGREYLPEFGETNPFLHMGMHIAIYEQLSTNRPDGIRNAYQKICNKAGDVHEAEHRIMDCLGEVMWQAQRNQTEPDEQAYLQMLKEL